MINAISRYPKYNVSFYGNKTYVIGHKNPDSDSVCSAIGQAYLENQIKTDKEKKYYPIAAGDINAETAYVLSAFGVKPPPVKKDVSLTVGQAMKNALIKDVSIQKDSSIHEFIELVMNKDLSTASVLNPDGTVAGVVSRKSLAEFIMQSVDYLKELKKMNIPYERIAKLINASVLTGSLYLQDTIKGDINIGACSTEKMEKMELKDGIVVVGDRKDIQKIAIEKGAKAVIVTDNSPVSFDIIELAKEKNVIVLNTKYDISTTTNILGQSVPVSEIMSDSVVSFEANQTVNDIVNVVKSNRFKYFPVVNEGKFVGIISRGKILAPNNNGIILVDHNNPSQFADGINKDDIEGVVDHHVQQLVLDSSRVPITYMPVGATATLVARNYKVNGVEIPKDIAGILWSAIISDTDKFTSVTTTPEDKKIANELAKIAQITEPDILANNILAQRDSGLENLSAEELIKFDLKLLKTASNKKYGIAQIKTYQSEKYLKNRDELEEALNKLDKETNSEGSVLMITDMSQDSTTYLITSSKIKDKAKYIKSENDRNFLGTKVYKSPTSYEEIINSLCVNDEIPRLINVQSRKEQVQPFISKMISE